MLPIQLKPATFKDEEMIRKLEEEEQRKQIVRTEMAKKAEELKIKTQERVSKLLVKYRKYKMCYYHLFNEIEY